MQNKLIEGAVDSYNTIAVKLLTALSEKETDSETINRLFDGLKEHRKTIKRLFKDSPSLEIYKPDIRKMLMEIRDNKDIFKTLNSALSLDEDDISDYYDGIDYVVDINSEYDLENFILRRMEAGAIIIGKSLPSQILKLFDKVKELYMFGSYAATIVFCRALIEETLKEAYHNQNPKISRKRIDDMNVSALLKVVKFPKEAPEVMDELNKVREHARLIIHRAMFGDTSNPKFNISRSALSAIRASTRAIEIFFS